MTWNERKKEKCHKSDNSTAIDRGCFLFCCNRGLYIIRGLLGGRMKDYVKVCKAEVIGIRHEGGR